MTDTKRLRRHKRTRKFRLPPFPIPLIFVRLRAAAFAPAARPRKLSWRQIANAIVVSVASFGLRLKSRREASSTSTFGCAAATDTKRLRRHKMTRKGLVSLEGLEGLESLEGLDDRLRSSSREFEFERGILTVLSPTPTPNSNYPHPNLLNHLNHLNLFRETSCRRLGRRFVSAASDETR